jgi:Fe-S cluster biogenesis protein NfuA
VDAPDLPADVPADLPAVGERIEQLLAVVRSSTDDKSWADVEELIRLLTDLYGAGLALALELGGPDLARRLAADELGAGLLALHGLHPDELAARVGRAVDRVAVGIRKGGGEVELSSVSSGDVRVALTIGGGCGSTAESLRQLVAKAVWDSAPDAAAVTVDLVTAAVTTSSPIRLGPTRLISAQAGASRAGGGSP